jgi:hypothetical protein
VGSFTTSNGLRPCQCIPLGDTTKTQAELETFLRSINHQYTQATYDLINHNCNNFSNTVAMFLVGHGIPEHIVDLPRIVFSTPGGMMLRPMIESMQSGISQNGGGMDPFGAGGNRPSGTNPLAELSNMHSSTAAGEMSSTSATTVSSVPASGTHPPANITTVTTVSTFVPTPEEKPFVSADVDAKTLNSLCNKILNFSTDNETKKALLGEEEAAQIRSTINDLGANSLSVFPHETFSLLGRLVQNVKPLQLASLFILRLLALHVHKRDQTVCSRDSAAYSACQLTTHSLLRMVQEADNNVFSSPSALVMAMCTLANLVSSQEGCDLLFRQKDVDEHVSIAEARVSACVDVCTWGLSNSKAEVRQMSATLAYNLALASTAGGGSKETRQNVVITQDIAPLPWRSLHATSPDQDSQLEQHGNGEELHQHVVQILCAVLETLGDETDVVSLGRKLHTAYYVCAAAGGSPALELVSELGFDDHVYSLRDKHHLLSEADRKRLGNFELLLKNVSS